MSGLFDRQLPSLLVSSVPDNEDDEVMLANLTEADKRMRDLDDQIAEEKQALIRNIEQSSGGKVDAPT
jgi:hypothetical protein